MKTAHDLYLATQKSNNGNTDATYSFLSSKYKLHMRMFYHKFENDKKQQKKDLRLFFLQQKCLFLQMCTWAAARVFPFSLCVGA